MTEQNRIYLCIDLKSFYASVECIERGLDPMRTNLAVADASRTEKTICLAVSPSLKSYGISGRARLFEVVSQIKKANAERIRRAPGRRFTGVSFDSVELDRHPELEIGYLAAPPRMVHYIEHSARIYNIYLKYIAPEDIHVYSIDEVFIDLTHYLPAAGKTAREFARMMIRDVLETTGIAELDEMSYRRLLWDYRPLTDFWRIGRGYAKKLEECGLYTMGDIALCSVGKETDFYNEELLYRMFGINAELLIDHAWGWEPCTIADIKAYRPENNSICSGQVLHCPYDTEKARLVVREMTDLLALDLVDKGLVTDQLALTVGYDVENLSDPVRGRMYRGAVTTDAYGRRIPKHGHGTVNLDRHTSSSSLIMEAVTGLYDRIADSNLLIRRLNLSANHVLPEKNIACDKEPEQLELFTDYEALEREREKEKEIMEREKNMQKAVLEIKKKFGKNAILKGMDMQEGATTKDRNAQIGGHKA